MHVSWKHEFKEKFLTKIVDILNTFPANPKIIFLIQKKTEVAFFVVAKPKE